MRNLRRVLEVGASRYGQQPSASWRGGAEEPSSTGLRAWLLLGTGYSNVVKNPDSSITIECIDASWAEANASDLVAHREAAFESLHPRLHPAYSNRSVAWPLISAYYSTYFSAQSLLRCFGAGTIYLEGSEASSMSAAWQGKGFSATIAGGTYMFSIDIATPTSINIRKVGGGGGAHQQFWSAFRQSQSIVHNTILASAALSSLGPLERQMADAEYLQLMNQCFTDARGGPGTLNFNWMSELRNRMNYRFSGQAWLMNWRNSVGLTTHIEDAIARYDATSRTAPRSQLTFSTKHLIFVATRFHQLVRDATTNLLCR